MKSIKFLLFFFLVNISFTFSQSRLKFGIYTNIGTSTYYGNKNSSIIHNEATFITYSSKAAVGLGGKALYSINNSWALNLNTTYQQRGAKFDKGVYSYTPSYNFNYIDVAFGLNYQTKEVIKKSKLFFNLNGSYNILLNSERKNNYESYNLMNESKMSDFGLSFHFGLNIPRVEKDLFQISTFVNSGLQNVFSGTLLENGQMGKNVYFGFQLAYLFGKIKKE